MDAPSSLRDRLATLRSAVRRRVLRYRRLLAGLAAGVAVLAALQALRPSPPATVTVWAAARDLPAGTVLTSGDVARVAWPPGAVPEHVVDDPIGETVAAPVRRGEPVTDVRLVGPELVAAWPGTVALPVRLPDTGVVALLEVGDRVDLYAADAAGTGAATLLGTRLPVIALPGDATGGDGPGVLDGTPPGRLVLLAVEPETAADVAGHAARSTLLVTISG